MEFQVEGKTAFAATGGRAFESGQPTIVFIHGGGADHTVWALQTRYFAHRGRNVLALDLPGHGRSAGPALSTIERMADWVKGCMDALEVAQAAIAGHSMGSLVALSAAIRNPERVRALALLGTSMPMAVSDELLAAARADDHSAFDMITIWGHSPAGRMGGNTAPGMWMTGDGVRLLERSGPGVLHADLKACNDCSVATGDLAGIGCPTFIVSGARDIMTPKAGAEAVVSAIPDAQSVTLADCGHMMMAERPNKVLDALSVVL